MENIKEMLKAAYDRGAIDERKNRTNDRLLEEGTKAIEEERTFDIYWQQLQNKQDISALAKKFEKLNKADVSGLVCEHCKKDATYTIGGICIPCREKVGMQC